MELRLDGNRVVLTAGKYLCARRAVPMIRAGGGGAIINLSPAAGRFGLALRTPYCTSEWAHREEGITHDIKS